jgi:pteridine reductase
MPEALARALPQPYPCSMEKLALVTGGAVRVGRALSLALAEAGYDVVVHYNRSRADAERTAAAIQKLGRRATLLQADLEQADAAERIGAALAAEHRRLNVLVNNAATFERAPVADITAGAWDRVLAVNLRAPFLLAQRLAPLLRPAEGGGLIVNIADLSAFQAWPSYAHHAVSKAGLVHLTRVLARALAPAIRVNAIAPGTVLPPEDSMHDDDGTAERRLTPVGGSPDDVARALLYLAASPFVTGEVLVVDGGRMWA